MRDHQDRDAVGLERLQDAAQHLFGVRVQSLGRLVQQQNLRLEQQHFRDGALLLLAAAEVVGVFVSSGTMPSFSATAAMRFSRSSFGHALRLEQLDEVVT